MKVSWLSDHMGALSAWCLTAAVHIAAGYQQTPSYMKMTATVASNGLARASTAVVPQPRHTSYCDVREDIPLHI